MSNSPKRIFELFRESMLSKSNEWKNLVAEDVELIGPLAQTVGKKEFIEINTPFFASIQSSELFDLIEHEGKIISRISTTVGLPNGKSLTLQVSEWYEIKDNEIKSLRVFFDTAEFRKELGMN